MTRVRSLAPCALASEGASLGMEVSPSWPKSIFARNLTDGSGIVELMDDLGEALTLGKGRLCMMGGGNPARIPAMEAVWRGRMRELLEDSDGEFDRILGDYDPPVGSPAFREAMAGYLRREFGWDLGPENIAVTNGGQTAFFFLLNRFAGAMPGGGARRILLPLVPEYIGYGDLGVSEDPLFESRRPLVERRGERRFKYRIDFDNLALGEDHGAIAVSRPTNPSSNVLTDLEMERLRVLAEERGVPLIVDGAYGLPFPGAVFVEAKPVWDENMVLTLSLSKLGLPGARTGIVVAREDLVAEIRSMTAVVGLANNNLGQALVRPLLATGRIRTLVDEVVRPYYRERAGRALALAEELLPADLPWRVHESEGAFFLWFWFEGLPVPCRELYRRLKKRGLLAVPGRAFFYGLDTEGWDHAEQCLRLSFAQPEEVVADGFRILGQVLREL